MVETAGVLDLFISDSKCFEESCEANDDWKYVFISLFFIFTLQKPNARSKV